MAKLIDIKCPKCSAPIALAADATSVTCRYCGGTSVIDRQHRTHAASTAPLVRRKSPLLVSIAVGMAIVGLASTASFLSQVGSSPQAVAGGEVLDFSDYPMLADVDGDGALDVVGQARNSAGERIVAYNSKDGAELWRTEPLSKAATAGGAVRAVLLGRVLSIDTLGKVQAYDLHTGTASWSAVLGDKAKRVCEGTGVIIIEAADEMRHGFDPATGKQQVVAKDAPCAPVFGSDRDVTPGYRIVNWHAREYHGLASLHDIEGLSADAVLVPSGPGPRFILGRRAKGSGVDMAAAVDVQGKELWKSIVPGVDPLTTDISIDHEAAFIDGKLVVPYALSANDAGTRIACFAAATGQRLWDVQALTKDDNSHGLSVSPQHVFMTSWFESAVALSLETGEVQYRLGRRG